MEIFIADGAAADGVLAVALETRAEEGNLAEEIFVDDEGPGRVVDVEFCPLRSIIDWTVTLVYP